MIIIFKYFQDSNSIPPSPHMPKIHNIHIRREGDQVHSSPGQPPRPRSAMSTATLCSETSVDFEVQNILGSKYAAAKLAKQAANEAQEIIIDFDSSSAGTTGSANNSFALNNGVKRSQTFNNRKNLDLHDNFHGSKGYFDKSSITRAHSIARSSAERSLDEMSLYDQKCLQKKTKKNQKKDPRVEDYRNMVLAEIKNISGPGGGQVSGVQGGTMSRSMSESDLSDLGGASPSPDTDTERALETSDADSCVRNNVKRKDQPRSRSSPGTTATVSTPSSGYSELTSSTGRWQSSLIMLEPIPHVCKS